MRYPIDGPMPTEPGTIIRVHFGNDPGGEPERYELNDDGEWFELEPHCQECAASALPSRATEWELSAVPAALYTLALNVAEANRNAATRRANRLRSAILGALKARFGRDGIRILRNAIRDDDVTLVNFRQD